MRYTVLVVEYERDGGWDNHEVLEIEAETLEDTKNKVKKPKSFINNEWGIRKIWDESGGENAPLYNGLYRRR